MNGFLAWMAGSGIVQGVIIGLRLSGEHAYRLHFPADQLPPNDAFWSLTATDTVGYMITGRAGRASVDSHSGLVKNADGSVAIPVVKVRS